MPENLQTYEAFLGKSHEVIMEVRKCPVNRMTMCVTSDEEKNKCVKMRVRACKSSKRMSLHIFFVVDGSEGAAFEARTGLLQGTFSDPLHAGH